MTQPEWTSVVAEAWAIRNELARRLERLQQLIDMLDTYRTWDSGRRLVPDEWLDTARAVAATKMHAVDGESAAPASAHIVRGSFNDFFVFASIASCAVNRGPMGESCVGLAPRMIC